MRSRLAACLTAVTLAATAPAPAALAAGAAAPVAPAVVIEFSGLMTVGCLNCTEPVTVDALGLVVGAESRVRPEPFTATGWEDTTPDPCPVLLQGSMTFVVGEVTGRLYWLRSTDGLVFVASGVSGRGMKDWAGTGTGVLLAEPVRVALESCGSTAHTYPVHAAFVVSPPASTR